MTENGRAPAPTELVYVPEPSWTPVFVAAGLAFLVVGIFAGPFWVIAGAVLGLLALRSWVRDVRDDLARLPRRQRLTTATLPATPMRRSARRPK
jgi:hypothetical protein